MHSVRDAMSIAELVRKHAPAGEATPGASLSVLHAVQSEIGYLSTEALDQVAVAFNRSRAEIHGIVSFYHDFRTAPGGRHTIQLCRAEACQAMGSEALEAHVRALLGIDYGETSADGDITLEPVYCLGNCACAPSVRIDDRVFGRVDAKRFDELVANLRRDGTPS